MTAERATGQRRLVAPHTPGLSYAVAEDGVELPVIDVTHPAFALRLSDEELDARTAEHVRQTQAFDKLPLVVQRLFAWALFRKSRLAKPLFFVSGGFLPGMDTYRLKLGPDNLGSWATPGDRRFASALPPLAMRLRLQDMAELSASALAPQLAARPGVPLCLLNIAGGPAIDSLNTLILLRQDSRQLLEGRIVRVIVLDQAAEAPAFGARARDALTSAGGALSGVHVEWSHVRYDWRDAPTLERVADEAGVRDAVCVVSSEGGLFEYGDDDAIVGNLLAAGRAAPPATVVVGSVTRADGPALRSRLVRLATRPRTLAAFAGLAGRAGWAVDEARTRPASYNVRLRRAG